VVVGASVVLLGGGASVVVLDVVVLDVVVLDVVVLDVVVLDVVVLDVVVLDVVGSSSKQNVMWLMLSFGEVRPVSEVASGS